jgi:hypothetical protein
MGMTWLRIMLGALVLGAGLTLVGSAPAFACSCAMQSVAEHADGADVVFAGTLTDADVAGSLFNGEQTTYAFEADAVYAGDPAPVAHISTASSGAACGLEGLVVGERYVVFAYDGGDGLSASLCGGTGPATSKLESAVENALGAPVQPGLTGGQGAGPPPPLPSLVTPWAWVAGLAAVVGPLWWLLARRSLG